MFKKILVPIDLGEPAVSEKICEAVAHLAAGSDAEIALMTVLPGFSMPIVAAQFPESFQKELREKLTIELHALAKKHFTGEFGKISVHIEMGKRAATILSKIQDGDFDLVVMGARKKKKQGGAKLLGSSTSSVSNRTPASVLIVR